MAVNKVDVNGSTVIDLTNDTVSADKLALGETAHDRSGSTVTGTLDVDGKISTHDSDSSAHADIRALIPRALTTEEIEAIFNGIYDPDDFDDEGHRINND